MAARSALTALALLLLLPQAARASVTVRKTDKGPTGYEVDWRYVNATAQRVLIGGGIYPFTDSLHTVLGSSDSGYASIVASGLYDPRVDYRPGDFYVGVEVPRDYRWPYEMTRGEDGVWTYTTPLPSAIYSFAYLVDCDYVSDCDITTGQLVIDPDLPPFENVKGDQVASSFQVPFDARFQSTASTDISFDANFDYALTAPEGHRGTVESVNYTSPGSIHPAPDVHDFTIYLPPGYAGTGGKNGTGGGKKKYPLMYLSHGAGGDGNDWQNLARMGSIMDHLILEGYIEPTVVVMPSFYNLDASLGRFIYGNSSTTGYAPSSAYIRENYAEYLFPWVESHYDVCATSSCRAFAGLSLGGLLTYEMYINMTDYFGYFGMFSPATDGSTASGGGGANGSTRLDPAGNPAQASAGVFVSYGLYDLVAGAAADLQAKLAAANVTFDSRVEPFGSHYWNTWQDALWWFGRTALWRPRPFTVDTGR
ncbi:Alpha/Beta hydrolase protein [Xylariaceae sp. FL0804]|nr:Alpha/Beta hydrolase protein [Xylariaceae sp. FL0804]